MSWSWNLGSKEPQSPAWCPYRVENGNTVLNREHCAVDITHGRMACIFGDYQGPKCSLLGMHILLLSVLVRLCITLHPCSLSNSNLCYAVAGHEAPSPRS